MHHGPRVFATSSTLKMPRRERSHGHGKGDAAQALEGSQCDLSNQLWGTYMRIRTHPGETLLEEFLKPLGLTAHGLALAIGVPCTRIADIVHQRRGVSADTAIRLAATSAPPQNSGATCKAHMSFPWWWRPNGRSLRAYSRTGSKRCQPRQRFREPAQGSPLHRGGYRGKNGGPVHSAGTRRQLSASLPLPAKAGDRVQEPSPIPRRLQVPYRNGIPFMPAMLKAQPPPRRGKLGLDRREICLLRQGVQPRACAPRRTRRRPARAAWRSGRPLPADPSCSRP